MKEDKSINDKNESRYNKEFEAQLVKPTLVLRKYLILQMYYYYFISVFQFFLGTY
jgi:hypothetical protein